MRTLINLIKESVNALYVDDMVEVIKVFIESMDSRYPEEGSVMDRFRKKLKEAIEGWDEEVI